MNKIDYTIGLLERLQGYTVNGNRCLLQEDVKYIIKNCGILNEDNGQVSQEVAEKYFPELKQSEDEKIRKEIKQFIQYMNDVDPRKANWLAWLEKQGEQKVTYTAIVETGNGGINALVQGELSADKVEPKFKVGDWIAYNHNPNLPPKKIIQITNQHYVFADCSFEIKTLETDWHLWSIEDAKDDDVLAFDWTQDNGASHFEKIVIFKGLTKDGVEGYGSTYKNGQQFFHDEVITYSKTWTTNLHPATKEQCDTLMKAMKDAGYDWDAEKKKLRKIEKQKQEQKFDAPKNSIEEDESITSRMEYVPEQLKPIAEFVIQYAHWNLHSDEWNQPVPEVPLFRVLDALAQNGKPYCGIYRPLKED